MPAAVLATAAAGCGGSSGPALTGPSDDAKAAAEQLLAVKTPDLTEIESVDCADADFTLTYRCAITSPSGTLHCAVRKEISASPYCLSEDASATEGKRRDALVADALRVAREQGRLAVIVKGMREGNFTIGCTLGFRTVRDGAAQTDDVVIDLIVVATETGRSVWATLTIAPDGTIDERTGVDPSAKPPGNGYGGCDLDAAGTATAKADHRDVSLLPSA